MIEAIASMKLAVALKTIFACLWIIGMFIYFLLKTEEIFRPSSGGLVFIFIFLAVIFGGLGYFVVMYG